MTTILPYARPLSYQHARAQFRNLAAELGAEVQSHPLHIDCDLQAETMDLTVELAFLPCAIAQAPRLVISSGLHGVEGYAGSHVQSQFMLTLLQRGIRQLPMQLVLVHGLNPWGFQMHRRTNEDGMDLNRNFLMESEYTLGGSRSPSALAAFINPKHAPQTIDDFWYKAPFFIARYGLPTLTAAIAAGQYQNPQGLFFGGHGPSACKTYVDSQIQSWFGVNEPSLHIDLHTGLGAFGTTQLFLETPCPKAMLTEVRQALHPCPVRADDEGMFATHGSIGRYLRKQIGPRYHCLTLEMGTHSPATIFRLLRRENQAHQVCGYTSSSAKTARQRLLDAFAPSQREWWETTIPRAVSTLWAAIETDSWSRTT